MSRHLSQPPLEESPQAFVERYPQLVTDTWPVLPVSVLDGGALRQAWDGQPTTAKPPRMGMLTSFLNLHFAEDAVIHAFARRYGLLGLCSAHGLPAGHTPGACAEPRIDPGPDGGYLEAVEDWRRWSRRLYGTVGLAEHLRRQQRVRPDDVEAVFQGIAGWERTIDVLRPPPKPSGELFTRDDPDGPYVPYTPPPWKAPSLFVQKVALAHWLNYLLGMAGVRPFVRLDRKTLAFALEDGGIFGPWPLFSVLTRELVAVCLQTQQQARCTACHRAFTPETRRERFCRPCRARGAPERVATQRYRASLRAQGLSSRGTPLTPRKKAR